MKFYLILLVGLACLVQLFWSAPVTIINLVAALVLLLIAIIAGKTYLIDQKNLNTLCNFYQDANALDTLLLLDTERPYQKILKVVVELGRFDWAILFLMDFDRDAFVAVESHGVRGIDMIRFDDLEASESHVNLALKLLDHAFKKFALKGALAGAAIERDDVFYGCLLVGRNEVDAVLTEEDNLRLSILSDQISISLHNYQMHQELSLRAEQLFENQQQLAKELNMAKIVQENAISVEIPQFQGLASASMFRPARFVGGDFLKFFPDPENERMGMLIGDVCGKGVPAALIMSVVLCLFQEKKQLWSEPAKLMHEVNLALRNFLGNGSNFNSSAIFADYSARSKTLVYASAGHDFPLLYKKREDCLRQLESTGTLLGIFAETEFVANRLQLEAGDKLVFYSDGLVDFFEAWQKVEDGFVELEKFIFTLRHKKPDEIVNEISALVESNKADIKDDITLAIIEFD